jgi:hypothetical protein
VQKRKKIAKRCRRTVSTNVTKLKHHALLLRRLFGRCQITDWLPLSGFLCLRANLDNLCASLPRFSFQRCVEFRRDVKLNHLRHDYLLMPENLSGAVSIALCLQ